jgi:hypothetical protein
MKIKIFCVYSHFVLRKKGRNDISFKKWIQTTMLLLILLLPTPPPPPTTTTTTTTTTTIIKLSLCLTNEAPCHEGVWGNECTGSSFLDLGSTQQYSRQKYIPLRHAQLRI